VRFVWREMLQRRGYGSCLQQKIKSYTVKIYIHCKNECALSNQNNYCNRLQAILFIQFNTLELSNNKSNYSLKVNHLK